jgi:AcrR family transcriptional regulator
MVKTASNNRQAEERIASRRSLRLVGRALVGDTLNGADVAEGPDLVGEVTAMPERSARAEPIRQHLMDAAEMLFARWGYTGVSLRDVTDLANRRLADVTYYFGKKQNLYFEVLKRRAAPLGVARLAELQRCDGGGLQGAAYVDAWVCAYLHPPIVLLESGEPGWSDYLRLIGHVAYSRLWPEAWGEFYNKTADQFMASLQRSFPAAGEVIIQQCFLMLTASSMYTLARTGRVETLAHPAFSSDDLDLLGPLTRDFIAAGVFGLLEKSKTADRPK